MTELHLRVRSALDDLCRDPDERSWKDTEWTRRVKESVIGLAHADGQRAYASQAPSADNGEWLYDVTWLDYPASDGTLTRTILVLESEWGTGIQDIEWDFLKLLLARADLRVMVFQATDNPNWDAVRKHLVNLVSACEQTEADDQYLFSGWLREKRSFRHEHYLHPG